MSAAFFHRLRLVLAEELAAHRGLIGVVLLYCALSLTLGFIFGHEIDLFLYSSAFLGILLAIVIWFVYRRAAKLAGKTAKGEFFNTLYRDVKERVNLNQAIGAALLFIVFSVYFSAFQSTKVMIPVINPFEYDPLFSNLDRQLHGGFYPHQLLQPVLGYPPVTFAIQLLYNMWFPIMLGVLAWQMFDRNSPALRMRFLVSFTLAWFVIGTLGAIGLSSAGPVYYDRITGTTGPYGELMDYLRSANEVTPLLFLDMQEMLWSSYSNGKLQSGAGISAMPSLHVSIAVLLWLFARHKAAWMAWALGIFAGVIMIGSVHLAWHYAIDGYIGATMMALIWWGMGFVYPTPVQLSDVD